MGGSQMNVIRIAGLGIAIWGLSLAWPQVNQVLTAPMMIAATMGLGVAALGYALLRHFDDHHEDSSAGQDHPSRPMPITAIR
jgi:phosphate/sulfate permease